eukprot:60454_1
MSDASKSMPEKSMASQQKSNFAMFHCTVDQDTINIIQMGPICKPNHFALLFKPISLIIQSPRLALIQSTAVLSYNGAVYKMSEPCKIHFPGLIIHIPKDSITSEMPQLFQIKKASIRISATHLLEQFSPFQWDCMLPIIMEPLGLGAQLLWQEYENIQNEINKIIARHISGKFLQIFGYRAWNLDEKELSHILNRYTFEIIEEKSTLQRIKLDKRIAFIQEIIQFINIQEELMMNTFAHTYIQREKRSLNVNFILQYWSQMLGFE